MSIDYLPLYISLISVSGTIILGIFQFRLTKANAKKSNADASEVITTAATALIEPYVKENTKLRAQFDIVQQDLEECLKRSPR
jgi:predicted glycosyl hydrolase (DUF1957 family)